MTDTKHTISTVPYISYEAMDEYAETIVHNFSPETIASPTVLDVERFVEIYLALVVEYKSIVSDKPILAMTAFNKGVVYVSEPHGQQHPILINAGSMIVDAKLLTKRNLARRRFTVMHEASHWILHRKFFENVPAKTANTFKNQHLAVKEDSVSYSCSVSEQSDIKTMERQADYLAAAMLMPKTTLRMAVRDFFAGLNEFPRKICRGSSEREDNLAIQLTEYVAKKFRVSKSAALIRLEKLDEIVGKPYWRCF